MTFDTYWYYANHIFHIRIFASFILPQVIGLWQKFLIKVWFEIGNETELGLKSHYCILKFLELKFRHFSARINEGMNDNSANFTKFLISEQLRVKFIF